ncbi:MAG TPA: ROK family protein [Acidobacteriaceae bacterium]|jgi:glucokinase|nr:ROK family protein [Acidobacteriaceae bacterium]
MTRRALNIGVDIGGTNIKLGLIDADGRILHQTKLPTVAERGSDVIIASIVSALKDLLQGASLRPEDLTSIGIGVPGTADAATGTVVYAPNIFWRDVPIVSIMQTTFPAPIYIAQDTRAAAWAEFLVGTARGLRGIAAVTLGTGIGCGMVLEGRIFHGALNTAGEFGHQIVAIDGEPCNCGRHGCLEAHAGGLAIVREAKKRIPNVQQLVGKEDIGVGDVYRLAQHGNPQARQIAEEVVRHIGVGLVNLTNLNSLEMICLSGGISNAPAELLLDPLVAFVRNRAYQAISDKVQICRSALGEDAPLIGASLLYHASSPRKDESGR